MNTRLAAQRVAHRHRVASFNTDLFDAVKKNKKQASAIKEAVREVGVSQVVKQMKNPKVMKTKDFILKKISNKSPKQQFNMVLEIFEHREEVARELLSQQSNKRAGIAAFLGLPPWFLKALAWITATKLGTVALIIGTLCVIALLFILGLMLAEGFAVSVEAFLRLLFVKFPLLILKAVLAPLKFMRDLSAKFDKKIREERSINFEELENPSDREEVEEFRRSRR